MALEGANQPASGDVPQVELPAEAAGEYACAVGRERQSDAADFEGADQSAGGGIPQLERPVVTGREHASAVGPKRHRSHIRGMRDLRYDLDDLGADLGAC